MKPSRYDAYVRYKGGPLVGSRFIVRLRDAGRLYGDYPMSIANKRATFILLCGIFYKLETSFARLEKFIWISLII